MIREAQIVIRRQVDHFLAVESRDRLARRLELAQPLIRPGFFQPVELLGQIRQRFM
jgi:hypothetical protein